MSQRLEGLRPQVEALVRFNKMPELGEPVSTEAPQLLKEVSASFRVCSVEGDELSLEAAPYCQSCSLRLDEDIFRRDAGLLSGTISRAMREHNRRLSSHGVRQILAYPNRKQLDKFINLVQVVDPSALTNVLDDEVVGFLRQLLKSGPE